MIVPNPLPLGAPGEQKISEGNSSATEPLSAKRLGLFPDSSAFCKCESWLGNMPMPGGYRHSRDDVPSRRLGQLIIQCDIG